MENGARAGEGLEVQLAAAPLDDATYLIYADWLQAQGDPRGELIALDDAARRAPSHERARWRGRRDALLARHPALVPPPVKGVALTWHLGFVRKVAIHTTDDVGAVFTHPSLRFATAITFGSTWPRFTTAHVTRLLAAAPSTIRRLSLDLDRRHANEEAIDVDAVLAAVPRLEHLFARRPQHYSRSSRLRSLTFVGVERATLAMLARAPLPALHRLGLHLREDWYRAPTGAPPVTIADLRPLLADPPPALTSLELSEVDFGDALLHELAHSALLPRLRSLRLWSAGITVAGARAVTRAAFGHLAQLDLSDPGLADETIALVADVCPEVRTISPRVRALVRGAQRTIP